MDCSSSDENVHREHFAADRYFFTHDWDHESLRLVAYLHLKFRFRKPPQTYS